MDAKEKEYCRDMAVDSLNCAEIAFYTREGKTSVSGYIETMNHNLKEASLSLEDIGADEWWVEILLNES